jgi:hypothetical protein
MTLTIQLSLEAEKKLVERAAQNGQTLEGYVQKLLEREAQALFSGQGAPGDHLTPELRDWLCQQVNEAETVADLQEVREKGGQELPEFLPDLEQVVHGHERTNR